MKLASLLAVLAVATMGFSSSALAVSSDDVSVTIEDPETDDTESIGGIMDSGINYEFNLENTMSNNTTTVDTYVEITDNSGNTVYEWVNGTNVGTNSNEYVTGEIDEGDLNVNDSVTMDVTATFTDDSASNTATASDSVTFELDKALGWSTFMALIELMIVLAVLGAVYERMS